MTLQIQNCIGFHAVRCTYNRLAAAAVHRQEVVGIGFINLAAEGLPGHRLVTVRAVGIIRKRTAGGSPDKAIYQFALGVLVEQALVTHIQRDLLGIVIGCFDNIDCLEILVQGQLNGILSRLIQFVLGDLHLAVGNGNHLITPAGKFISLHRLRHRQHPQDLALFLIEGKGAQHRIDLVDDLGVLCLVLLDFTVYDQVKHIPALCIRLTGRHFIGAVVLRLYMVVQRYIHRHTVSLHDPDLNDLTGFQILDRLDVVALLQLAGFAAEDPIVSADIIYLAIFGNGPGGLIHRFLARVATGVIIGIEAAALDIFHITVVTSLGCLLQNSSNFVGVPDHAVTAHPQTNQRCQLLIDKACHTLVLGLNRDLLAFACHQEFIIVLLVGLALGGLGFRIEFAFQVVVDLAAINRTGHDKDHLDLIADIAEGSNLVAYPQIHLAANLFAVFTGNGIVDLAIGSKYAVPLGIIKRTCNGNNRTAQGIHIRFGTQIGAAVNTSSIINTLYHIAVELQTHTAIVDGFHLVCDLFVGRIDLDDLAVGKQLKGILTLTVGSPVGALIYATVVTFIVIVHGAVHRTTGNKDQDRFTIHVSKDVYTILQLQSIDLFAAVVLIAGKLTALEDLAILRHLKGDHSALIAGGRQTGGSICIAVNAGDVVVGCDALAADRLTHIHVLNNVAFLVKQKRKMTHKDCALINGVDDGGILTLQIHHFALMGKCHGVNTVFIRHAGGQTCNAVIAPFHTPVDLCVHRILQHEDVAGILAVQRRIYGNSGHDLQRAGHTGILSALSYIVNIRAGSGDLQLHTVHGYRRVDSDAVLCNLLDIEAVGKLCCHFLAGNRIHDHTVSIENKAQCLHAVDVVDKLLVNDLVFFDTTVHGKTGIVIPVLRRFTTRETFQIGNT